MQCIFSATHLLHKERLPRVFLKSCGPKFFSMEVKPIQVTPHLTLRTTDNERNPEKNIVLLLPWLYAPPKAVNKYCQLYHARNMDVLCANLELKNFLRPSTGRLVAKEILDFLNDKNSIIGSKQLLVHAFSIGAYLYAIMLLLMERNSEKYAFIRDRITAQIFDSIVVGGLDKMGHGVAAVTSFPFSKSVIKGFAATYFWLTKSYTINFYNETIDQFKFRPNKAPVLFFYCHNDPMSDAREIKEMIENWRGEKYKMIVQGKGWDESTHAAHLLKYPQEYQTVLDDFLFNSGIYKQKVQSKL